MDTKSYYAMTFYNTTDTMQTEKKAKALFPIRVMPTPRAVSVSADLPSGLRERTKRHTQNLQKT